MDPIDTARDAVLTEAMVGDLVMRFYDRVRADDQLGPLFAVIVTDWDAHLRLITDFWSAVLLRTSRYRGCVFSAHFGMKIEAEYFDRWMNHFRASVSDVLPPAAARDALGVADAVNLRLRQRAVRA